MPFDATSVRVGVIGGSGLYNVDHLEFVEAVKPSTPWGPPSDAIRIYKLNQVKVAFLARHGKGHPLNPSEVPYRANIAALKSLGVEIIVAFSAVGSLREEICPMDFVLPRQVIDRTKGIRPSTFFEAGCAGHVEFADPFCEELINLVHRHAPPLDAISATDPKPTLHRDKTLVVMEGPAFSTRAESHLYRSWGCDIVNMSTLPEAKLAREAEIAYAVVCMATDYDCWRESEDHVTVDHVLKNLSQNTHNAKRLIECILPHLVQGLKGVGRGSVTVGQNRTAVITPKEARNPDALKALNTLLPGYY